MGNFDESVWNCAHSIMPKTPFGGGSGSATDVESLLTLHGVLCAFLVSLSIGFEANLAAASTERMNFFGALAKEPSFRARAAGGGPGAR